MSAVTVQCAECGHVGRVVGCVRFACAACGRIDATASGSIYYAFATGWAYGATRTALTTPREVGERYPAWDSAEVTAYLNGAEDGARGDRFRLEMGSRA